MEQSLTRQGYNSNNFLVPNNFYKTMINCIKVKHILSNLDRTTRKSRISLMICCTIRPGTRTRELGPARHRSPLLLAAATAKIWILATAGLGKFGQSPLFLPPGDVSLLSRGKLLVCGPSITLVRPGRPDTILFLSLIYHFLHDFIY